MHYSRKKSRFCHLLSVCIALTLFNACTVDDITGLNYDEISEIGNYFGDANQDVVVLNAQGGAMTYLDDQSLIDLVNPVNTDLTIIANVSQRQMRQFPPFYTRDITTIEAKSIINDSVDDLASVVRHFKSQNKTVYVMGQNYGGYLVQELIAKYGSDIADAYLVMGSRLTIEEDFTKAWGFGHNASYDFIATPTGVQTSETANQSKENANRLFGSIGREDYMSKLQSQDLSNLYFVHTSEDEIVGALQTEELNFLTEKGVNLMAETGDHKTAVNASIAKAMNEAFGLSMR